MKSLSAYQNMTTSAQVEKQLTQRNHATEQVGLITLSFNGKVEWITPKAGELLCKYCSVSNLSNSLPDIIQRWAFHQISLLAQQSTEIPSPLHPLYLEHHQNQLIVTLNCHLALERVYLLLEEIHRHRFSPQCLEILGLTK